MHRAKRNLPNALAFVILIALCFVLAACSSEEQAPPPQTSSAKRPASVMNFEGGATPSTDLPPGHPPLTQEGMLSVPAGAGMGGTGLTWSVPEGWQQETPSSAMRYAQYKVPSATGDAELVVFYFGPGQGGDARSNAERWAQQFSQPDGRSPLEALKTEETVANGMKVLLVETTGNYNNSMAPMASAGGAPLGNQMLLASIVEGPDANWFFKLTGPQETVESQREGFALLTQSVRPDS